MHGHDSYGGQRPVRLVRYMILQHELKFVICLIFVWLRSQGNNVYGASDPSSKKVTYARRSPSRDNGDGTRDASSDFAVMNSETVVIQTRDHNGNGVVPPPRISSELTDKATSSTS